MTRDDELLDLFKVPRKAFPKVLPSSLVYGHIDPAAFFGARVPVAGLADCLMRRTMVGLDGQLGLDAVERAASVALRFPGWDEGRASGEAEAYRRYVERFKPPASAAV